MRTLTASKLALGCILSCLLATGCRGMPKDWPIPELKPPNGSVIKAPPESRINVRERLQALTGIEKIVQVRPQWEVAFSYANGWSPLRQNIDAQLQALGYSVWQPPDERSLKEQLGGLVGAGKLDEILRIYTKPDGPYTVTLLNVEAFISTQHTVDSEGEFILAIQQAGGS